ncbi:MAG: uroporphyrinogen-III synthase [Pseudomonadota bacterium]
MSKVLAIRPEPGLSSTLESGRALGLDIIGKPLFEIVPVAWDCPDPATVDGLLIGSANAILHGGEQLHHLMGKPVHAVGRTTAETARAAGFQIAAIGQGGLQNVLDTVEPPARLLRLAGAEHVSLTQPSEVGIQTEIVYKSNTLSLKSDVISAIGGDPIILLHSAAAARHFASECDRLGLKRERLTLALLGPRIAEAAGHGWKGVCVSPHPNDNALLEMIRDMCV